MTTPTEIILKEHIKTLEAWNKQQQEQIDDYKKRLENVGKGSEKVMEGLIQTHEAAVMVLKGQIDEYKKNREKIGARFEEAEATWKAKFDDLLVKLGNKDKAIMLLEKERDEARELFGREQKYASDLIQERNKAIAWGRGYEEKYNELHDFGYLVTKAKERTVTTQTLVTPLSQAIPCRDSLDSSGVAPLSDAFGDHGCFDAAMYEAGLTPLPSQEEEATRL